MHLSEGEGCTADTGARKGQKREYHVFNLLWSLSFFCFPGSGGGYNWIYIPTFTDAINDWENIKGQWHFPLAADFLFFYAVKNSLGVTSGVWCWLWFSDVASLWCWGSEPKSSSTSRLLWCRICLQFPFSSQYCVSPHWVSAVRFNSRCNSAHPLDLCNLTIKQNFGALKCFDFTVYSFGEANI